MEKLYRVKMNENGMPNFSTAEEVEPKHGEWIYVTVEEWMKTGRDYGHHCSECDEVNETGKSNYCPACGAKMTDRNISNEMYGQMKRMIKVAPSVTVKPKHGEWIYPSDVSGFGRCENCNALWGKDLIDNIFFIHCPRCGAKMKGADDE